MRFSVYIKHIKRAVRYQGRPGGGKSETGRLVDAVDKKPAAIGETWLHGSLDGETLPGPIASGIERNHVGEAETLIPAKHT